ncbi:putative pre-mrna-processing atp-dependent rna helicase prp5 [Phaeomoniella chlamydospora]|uniref:Pre-mRNA-processing ATP-dependent RNA helicase PRP5 n=1 Tax=Phaeomoniella chlamydospora TaxID=158046 RepID=A0A0G2GLA4_PHACM|nr:putative pre-mrna-processing atp-dependent rna helicase prp5 [Phaeomoniella chlamydospora]
MTTIIGLAERIGTGQGNGDTRKIDLTKEMNAGEVVIETFEGEMNPEIATAIDEMTPLTLGKSLEGMTAGIGCLTEAQWYSPASKPATPPAPPTEEQQKAARLARIQAWKEKQAAEREKKQKELDAAGSARSILAEIDKKFSQSPAYNSPKSPPTPEVASPAPYAGKFDPKAITKKASTTTASKSGPLGADVGALAPKSTTVINGLSSGPLPANGMYSKPTSTANTTRLPTKIGARPAAPLKAKGNLSGFGLHKATAETDSLRKGLDFGEEESTRKKLEKLPTPPLDDATAPHAADAVGDAAQDDDDDAELPETGTEEEALAAARALAEKREEALRNGGDAMTGVETDTLAQSKTPDIEMTDVPTTNGAAVAVEEEEIDPLDAFMSDLTDQPAPRRAPTNLRAKSRLQEPEVILSDEDEPNMDAVGGDTDDILAIASKKKKKDIPAVNHGKMNYLPFRKNFYSEPIEMADLTEDEVAALRAELDGIKVRGVDVPKPVQKWAQCGLGVQVLDVIQRLGYDAPTSIQCQAVPAIMSGRDVIGVAKTGSGKTIAFLLPMFRHIKDQKPLEALDGPIGLIMTPTRELATQIHRECKPFLKALNLRAVCAYGGAPIKDQIAELKRGAEIVVCTPGRIIDLLAANSGRVTNLRRVTYIVLDEADRMFDMGFEPQVMKILGNIRPDRQTVLFSATFPRQMEALARKTLNKPVEIVVGGRSVVAPEITQIVEVRNEDSKFHRLLELLGNLYAEDKNEDDRALIFVDRQDSADGLLRDLMQKGYPCMSIHGGKDQIDRDSTIDDFKNGVFPVLIATSVAARGLDVKQLKLVVNYDAPNHLEDYVHRAGRTGRAGNTGTAVTFITESQDRYAVDIAKALKQSGQPVPDDVQKLVDSFMEKVKAGKEKASGSGFGGKGLERLDQDRDAARARERKTYKTGDEPEEEEKEEPSQDIISKAASGVRAHDAPPAQLPGVPKGIDLDGKITVHRTERDTTAGPTGKLDRVSAAVAGINERLSRAGVMRQGVPIDNKGPDAGAFHATLEINDFPQKARWAVTNRTNVAKILEATGTSITTKGTFYAAGKEPEPGQNPKLYILVEGDTEVVVTNAMRELMRLLKDGTIAAADSEARAPTGRYSVV